jgi:hypothetical protein
MSAAETLALLQALQPEASRLPAGTPEDHAASCACDNGRHWGLEEVCFRCAGKGYQDAADVRRNRWYDHHRAA